MMFRLMVLLHLHLLLLHRRRRLLRLRHLTCTLHSSGLFNYRPLPIECAERDMSKSFYVQRYTIYQSSEYIIFFFSERQFQNSPRVKNIGGWLSINGSITLLVGLITANLKGVLRSPRPPLTIGRICKKKIGFIFTHNCIVFM